MFVKLNLMLHCLPSWQKVVPEAEWLDLLKQQESDFLGCLETLESLWCLYFLNLFCEI